MAQLINGPGIGLPAAQNLYPSQLYGAPIDTPGNRVTLSPGDAIAIPAGHFYIDPGMYNTLEFNDPILGWQPTPTCAWTNGPKFVVSDGFNYRVANRTGCIVGAVVTAYGSGYVQASTTVSVVGSTATFLPIVGGQVGGASVTTVGGGYGVAPIVLIPPPPAAANNANGVGGIPASGYAVIAGGTVSGFTFTNPGAGYQTAPLAVVVPSPFDPNLSIGVTQASITFSLVGSGSLTGAICTNSGAPLTNGSLSNVTLTVGGAGTAGTLTPVVLQTVVAGSVVGAGLNFGTVSALMASTGGGWPAGTITNSQEFLGLRFRPRPAIANLVVTGAGSLAAQVGTIIDGGLFASAPTPVLGTAPAVAAGTLAPSGATLSFVMGSRPDVALIQPAP